MRHDDVRSGRWWSDVFRPSHIVPSVLTVAGVLAAVGGATATRTPAGDAHPWFAWSLALCFITVLEIVLYLLVVPAMWWLEGERVRWLARSQERLVVQRIRLARGTEDLARLDVAGEPTGGR